MSVKITCIKKDNGNHENPYVAIKSMNWLNDADQKTGTSSRAQIYDFVNEGHEAYVEDAAGHKAKLVAKKTDKGTKYVKTVKYGNKTVSFDENFDFTTFYINGTCFVPIHHPSYVYKRKLIADYIAAILTGLERL